MGNNGNTCKILLDQTLQRTWDAIVRYCLKLVILGLRVSVQEIPDRLRKEVGTKSAWEGRPSNLGLKTWKERGPTAFKVQ